MAFQRRSGGGNKGGGHDKPAMSVAMSAKQGNGYIKGPSFGLWANPSGGPSFRGSLKDARLEEVLEFMTEAYEAGLGISLAVFDNNEGQGGGGFKKSGGFKKQGGFKSGSKFSKPNPFSKRAPQQEEEEQEGPDEGEQGPEF